MNSYGIRRTLTLFFLSIPRPPTSTLFPYTTLFRSHETEADRMGVELAARAGYDPRAAIALWQKMAKLSSGGAPPKLLSTHPSHEDRIKDLTEFSQKVLPLYEEARVKK